MTPTICGVVCHAGQNGEPIACGFPEHHNGAHSWASLETYTPNTAELAVIGKLAIAFRQCEWEFEDQPECCGEHKDALDSAIDAYQIARMGRDELKSRLMAHGYDGEALETFAAQLRQLERGSR